MAPLGALVSAYVETRQLFDSDGEARPRVGWHSTEKGKQHFPKLDKSWLLRNPKCQTGADVWVDDFGFGA